MEMQRLWTDDYLLNRLNGRQFLVSSSSTEKFDIFSSRMRDSETYSQVTFGEFLQLVNGELGSPSGVVHYMQQKTIQEAFPELVADVDYACVMTEDQPKEVNLWFSQKGSNIPLHHDTYDNLLAQVRGNK